MNGRYPEWDREGKDWPHRDASQFITTAGYRWHVQTMGPQSKNAPFLLLLHGTGAATHSWRDIVPLLARDYRIITVDLPGHGFTRPTFQRRVTLPAMAHSITSLMDHMDVQPDMIIGHSAGAAIGAQMLLESRQAIPLIGFTPALMPFPGLAAKIFPSLARILFTNPFVAIIFARLARGQGEVEKFLGRSTGSEIDREGLEYYRRLFTRSGHCDGAIRMMANWDLEQLSQRLPELSAPVLLLHAQNDKAIPEKSVMGAAALLPNCDTRQINALGHLAHEEDPQQAAAIIREFAQNMLSA